jgi:oligopeptide/dipeptide ABC transporter ATP-binding protein
MVVSFAATSGGNSAEPVLEVRSLSKWYPVKGRMRRGHVHAVDDVTFSVARGETLALVGESGSGKSTTARTILRLEEPTRGEVYLEGRPVTGADALTLRRLRARMQIVFQDPLESLNPRITVGELVAEPLWLSGRLPRSAALERARTVLSQMQLPPDVHLRYPHQLSGGQQQRVGIARALATEPAFVVLDEPTSALDVSVQAQIINLLRDLQQEKALAFLFISHDLRVVGYLAQRVAVMYLGHIVELGPKEVLFERAAHPYTRALIAAAPATHPRARRERVALVGEPPSPIDLKPECRFASRCPFVQPECRQGEVPLTEVAPGHLVRCVRYVAENRGGVWEPEPNPTAARAAAGTTAGG